MGNDELHATVGDYVTLVRGTTYRGDLVGSPGPALLGLGSIEPGGGFRVRHYKTYGGDCPADLMLFPGDMYASLKGATKDGKMIGSVARVPASITSGRLTQDTVKLVFRSSKEKYASLIYWMLRTPQYREYCEGHAMGSAVVALSRRDFLKYPLPEPTETRLCMVQILDAIEDRIEASRRLGAALEAMARAIFKDWFVDFGPTRAKIEGRAPYLAPEIWSLFPDRLDAEGKPEGWRSVPLDQIADFLNGLALQKYPGAGEADLPVIKIAELRAGSATGTDRASSAIPSQYVIADGDVLFSWSGSLIQRIWTGGRGALNQHLFKVTSKSWPKWLHYFWVDHHLASFQAIAASKATTMGHIQRHHLSEAETFLGPDDVMSAADKTIAPLFQRIVANDMEARTLAATRDLLLPKLMSGELCVQAAERAVEAVT